MAHERAEQVHDLDVILPWMVFCEALQRVDPAQPDRQQLAAKHPRALLIALVQKSLLG